jgi:hypothetical protein
MNSCLFESRLQLVVRDLGVRFYKRSNLLHHFFELAGLLLNDFLFAALSSSARGLL